MTDREKRIEELRADSRVLIGFTPDTMSRQGLSPQKADELFAIIDALARENRGMEQVIDKAQKFRSVWCDSDADDLDEVEAATDLFTALDNYTNAKGD